MTLFTSDNVTPACPDVIEAIVEANNGLAASYGDDRSSSRLRDKLSEIFETDVLVFPVVTGTASNALARLPRSIVARLHSDGFDVNEGELDGSAARFVAAWNTEPSEVDRLLESIAGRRP